MKIVVVLQRSTMVTVEFLNQVAGFAFGAGEHRLEAAGKMGISRIVSTEAIEVLHWYPRNRCPKELKSASLFGAIRCSHRFLAM